MIDTLKGTPKAKHNNKYELNLFFQIEEVVVLFRYKTINMTVQQGYPYFLLHFSERWNVYKNIHITDI